MLFLKQAAFISLVFGLYGCATTPKEFPPLEMAKPYDQAFRLTKKYVQACLPNANLRANLFTDIPEAEIVIDHLPAATMVFIGTIGTSTYEPSREIVNIHFFGNGKSTKIVAKSQLGLALAQNAIDEKPCPETK